MIVLNGDLEQFFCCGPSDHLKNLPAAEQFCHLIVEDNFIVMTNNVMIILLGSLDKDIDEGGKFTLVDLAIPVIWFFSLSTFCVSVLLLFAVINVSFVISFFVFSFRPVLKSNFLVPQQETKMQKRQTDKK